MNNERNENITKFKIKLKFPFFNSLSFFTYREKSPKLNMTIEKYAKTVPVTVKIGSTLLLSTKFPRSKNI